MERNIFALIKGTRELELEGYSPAKITRLHQNGELTQLRKGIYIETKELQKLTDKDYCLIQHQALARRFKDPIFSHTSAALIWGAPLLHLPATPHISFTRAYKRAQTGLKIHTRREELLGHTWSAEGLTITSPLHTIADCTRTLPVFDALCIADWFLNEKHCTRIDLLPQLETIRGRGRKTAQVLAHCASALTESPAESFAILRFYEWGISPPEQQIELITRRGYHYRPDFIWREHGIILEVDGNIKYYGTYRSTEEQFRRENFRQRELEADGWTIVRTTWSELRDTPHLLRERLARHGIR
ncbi:MAG: type IV toxin-antitoxin system AbiEi family antitoxin domain-containing protein [Rothia sp. (in: high G+C Gram-positive bacteria)]|nr:type IV toxin-antitoxin system AbiEi family antitoxin domain-containing protein [Rothia sp. (in: high G+C Gram-positive bacteria)]